MKIAIKNRNITPTYPCLMGGYERTEKSHGILDDIELISCVMQWENQYLILCCMDTICIDETFYEQFSKHIAKKYHIHESMVNLACIHTHSAPAIFSLPTTKQNESEEKLKTQVSQWILEDIDECMHELKEVTCTYESVHIEGIYGNRNLKNGTADKEISILTFYHHKQKVAALINMACHPTILNGQNFLLSTDLLGNIRKELSKKWQIPILLFNGASGDVSTRFYRTQQSSNTVLQTAQNVIKQITTLNEKECLLTAPKVETIQFDTHFDILNDHWTQQECLRIRNNLQNDPQKYAYEKNLLHRLQLKQEVEQFNCHLMSHIYLLGQVLIITVPGELVSRIGLYLKSKYSNYHVIIIAYCNNYVSYLVDQEDYGCYFESYVAITPKGTVEKWLEKVETAISNLLSANK